MKKNKNNNNKKQTNKADKQKMQELLLGNQKVRIKKNLNW